ncbi:hypothetical protein D3C73_1611760 [compost metagenome]
MFLWMGINHIIPVASPVKTDLALATSNVQLPDGLSTALAYDLQHSAKHLEKDEGVKKFIDYLSGVDR